LNPNARLYLRVTDSEPAPYIAPEELVNAVMRAARLMHRAVERRGDLADVWEAAIVQGMAHVEPDERETLRWYHRRVLDLIDQAERNSNRHEERFGRIECPRCPRTPAALVSTR